MILFEGIDKTGKSTLHKAFDKAVNYKYLTCERYFVTYLAYCLRYNREIDFVQLFRDMPQDLLIVHLICSNKEHYYNRLKEHKHEYINDEEDDKCFNKAIEMILKLNSIESLNFCGTNKKRIEVLTLDTSILTEATCVEEIKLHATYFL